MNFDEQKYSWFTILLEHSSLTQTLYDNHAILAEHAEITAVFLKINDNIVFFLQQVVIEDLTDASEMVDIALVEDMNGIIPEEPQEFRHATSLDSALQHLIPTLQTNKGLFIL